MEKQIVFSGEDIVTIRLALYEAENSLRARAELYDENYSKLAESAQKTGGRVSCSERLHF